MKTPILVTAILMMMGQAYALDNRPWMSGSSGKQPTQPPATNPQVPVESPGASEGPPPVQMIYPQPYIYIPPPAPPRQDWNAWTENEVMTMTPEEIKAFKENYRKRQAAASDAPPEVRTLTIPLSLDPGAPLPTIRVSPGFVSSLVFLDAMGSPWPVKGVTWGNKDAFGMEPPPEGAAGAPQNVVAVSARREIGTTNASVLLEGKSVPVVLQLTIDRKNTDARVDLRLNEYGPLTDAKNIPQTSLPEQAGDTVMTAFLDGVPPKDARELKVEGAPMRAWVIGETMYLRTIASLLSPAFDAVEHGASGVRVYRLRQTPVVLYAHQGTTQMARIEDNP